ncbi:MAG: polynucleotide kinase-phosphatase [Pirellulales bacterium]
MLISLPTPSLVVLIGATGSGKSTFARRHFLPTEVLSSDAYRGLVADDENDQDATGDAFDALHYVAAKRLARGRVTVIDATNVQADSRRSLVQLARDHDVMAVAIVLRVPENVCHERNRQRPDRGFGPHVVRKQSLELRRGLRGLSREGFRQVVTLSSPEEIDAATIERTPLWTDRRGDHGPFDIIGDVHGCCSELEALLAELGYEAGPAENARPLSAPVYRHPLGRRVIFLGDLVDRGPRVLDALRLAASMVTAGSALCVPGNHDVKLLRHLRGKNVQVAHGLAQSVAEIDALPAEEAAAVRRDAADFLDNLISHYVLDDGRLVVAHAGMKAEYQGRASGRVREFALYGETTGESDEFGLPIRLNWAADYRGRAMVVYGHTPVANPEWFNRTINIDTGCVYGGSLTALRYPELELVSVPAAAVYAESAKRFLPSEPAAALSTQQEHDDLLDLDDLLGKRLIGTRLMQNVTVREENAVAALEVMSRFALNPKWLIYLPPTMSPCETSQQAEWLEYPSEAFAYFRRSSVPRCVCQEKHMGSRAVAIICRNEETVRQRFGIVDEGIGACYTRTGRRFFEDAAVEREVLGRLHAAVSAAGWWEEFASDWFCLDCELLPWSAKAQELLRSQYAPVGAAAQAALAESSALLAATAARLGGEGEELGRLAEQHRERLDAAERYVAAYRRYCWHVRSANDLRLAPFHLLASEGHVHVDRDHTWHMQTLALLAAADASAGPLLVATRTLEVEVTDPASEAAACQWWEELTAAGGEGMVVKPREFVARGPKGLVQPAVKCRGREYLRIIYGPEYTRPEQLERLRSRGLGRKRSLALREFALGIEALERFVRREPLRRVHECTFAVLALESEPVDPRL